MKCSSPCTQRWAECLGQRPLQQALIRLASGRELIQAVLLSHLTGCGEDAIATALKLK